MFSHQKLDGTARLKKLFSPARAKAIPELHALVHILDMHQMTKDPEHISATPTGNTETSKRPQNLALLTRYLDQGSDPRALASKTSAFSVRIFDAPGSLAAANEIENLTNGHSRKFWNKIRIFVHILTPGGSSAATNRA